MHLVMIGGLQQLVLTPTSEAAEPSVHITGIPAALILIAAFVGLATLIWRFFYHRRRAATLAERAQMQYRALFESSPAGMFLYDTRTQRVLEGNPALCEITGHTAQELTRLSLADIFPADIVEEAARDYGSGKLMPAQLNPIFTTVRRRDGTLVDVDARGRPMDPELGHARVVMVLNVSEQLAAERALRDAERQARQASELLQSVIDVAPQAIIALDLDLNVTMWNRAAEELFGYAATEVLGRYLPIVSDDERDAAAEGIHKVQNESTVRAYDTVRTHKDGTRIALLGAAGVRRDHDGIPTGYVVLYTDMRQYRHLEAQLRQSQKMEAVGRLAGGVAHDFNNMLTVITAYVQLLRLDHPQDDVTAPLLEIEAATTRAAALTRQLLTFSRMQVVTVATIDVSDVIARLQPMLRRVSAANIELHLSLADDVGFVRVDPAQLEQVIVNLAMNAMDAMPHGGALTIETANIDLDADYARLHQDVTPGPYVMIAVSDMGTGMDSATIAKIFEPFYTTKPAGYGTGLGLAIAYSVVKQANGHIYVYSEIGQGTTFKIFLPRASEPAERTTPPSNRAVVPRGGTLLVVEDDDAVRRSVKATLLRIGYNVLEAESGEAALALLAENNVTIDALLTDLMMPGMSGRELAEHVVAMRPSVRVLLMSGYTNDEVLRRQLVDAGQHFLQKPFTKEQLVSAIEGLSRDRKTPLFVAPILK